MAIRQNMPIWWIVILAIYIGTCLLIGVIFDPELSFSQHSKEKINKAYAMLGIIKRNFIYLSEEAFVSLYKTLGLVRSHLEYANSVWNPYRMGLIKDIEKVQMRATKLVLKLKHLKYKERFERLNYLHYDTDVHEGT